MNDRIDEQTHERIDGGIDGEVGTDRAAPVANSMDDGSTGGDGAERRVAMRQRTLKRGRVSVKGVETMQCVIRNMSLTGARVAVGNSATLPDRFELFIGDEGLHREVEVMSRSEQSAGLRFLRPLSARELGAEFMSMRSTTQHRAEREAARYRPAPEPAPDHAPSTPLRTPVVTRTSQMAATRAAVAAPPVEGPSPGDAPPGSARAAVPTGLPKIVAAPLPGALARHLPWGR